MDEETKISLRTSVVFFLFSASKQNSEVWVVHERLPYTFPSSSPASRLPWSYIRCLSERRLVWEKDCLQAEQSAVV